MRTTVARSMGMAIAAACLLLPMVTTAAAGVSHATRYAFTQVVPLPSKKSPPCFNAYVNSVNNRGKILGTMWCGASRGFVELDGHTKVFRVPGKRGTDTEAAGVSNNGLIVLYTQHDYKGRFTSYVRALDGKFTKIADPKAGKLGTVAESINDSGEIVGYYFSGSNAKNYRAFVDIRGKFRTYSLKLKSARHVVIEDVTNSGEFAGYFIDGRGVSHGFLVEGGKTRVINAPGAGKKKSEGTEISFLANDGSFGGGVTFGQGPAFRPTYRGFVNIGGHFRTVNVPKSWGFDTFVTGINDSGEIVGGYHTVEGNRWFDEAFTAEPLG
jgi:hypothetical protein